MGYQKGEVVLRDQPFAYVIKLDCRSKVCDYCVKSPETNKPLKNCSACKIVYYCNANCQKSAWNSHHQGKVSQTDFGRSVNPISTKGGRLCPPNITGTPRFSDLPMALYCIKKLQFFVLIKISVKVIIRLWSSLHLFVDCELFFSGLGLHC